MAPRVEVGKPGTNFLQVTPEHRKKINSIVKYYRKKPHPFRACLSWDTPVSTPAGDVPISQLREGDEVWSFNECEQAFEAKPVKWADITRRDARVVAVELEDGTTLRVTPDHPFLTLDGRWVSAGELRLGELLTGCVPPRIDARALAAVALPVGAESGEFRSRVSLRTHGRVNASSFPGLEGRVLGDDVDDSLLAARRHQRPQGDHNRDGGVSLDAPLGGDACAGPLVVDAPDATEDHLQSFQRLPLVLDDGDNSVRAAEIVRTVAASSGAAVPPETAFAFHEAGRPSKVHRSVIGLRYLDCRENVWDIEVESNHTFVAGGAVVHNCVRDNRRRFGPRTEQVCAVVKDMAMGTTKWRKGGKKHLAAEGVPRTIDLSASTIARDLVGLYDELAAKKSSTVIDLSSPTATERLKAAKQKKALPGGRFPIQDHADVKKAVRAVGRAKPADRPKVRAHIKRRAKALGAGHLIPNHWP